MNYDKCMRKECKRCKDYINCFKEEKKNRRLLWMKSGKTLKSMKDYIE